MISITCADLSCGVVFGLPQHIYDQARGNSSRYFKCPNGHEQHYTEDRVAKLEKQLAEQREWCDSLHKRVTTLENRNSSPRGVITRLNNWLARRGLLKQRD